MKAHAHTLKTSAVGLSGPPVRPHDLSVVTFEVDGEQFAVLELAVRPVQVPPQLSKAEQEVALLVLQEKSNLEIARIRKTSVNTVANQLRSVYVKLGISGRAELIHYCVASRP